MTTTDVTIRFYVVGGLISIVSWWILALFVHPPNERPDRYWQCTRHWCHGEEDPWYADGGVFEGQVRNATPHNVMRPLISFWSSTSKSCWVAKTGSGPWQFEQEEQC
jgi:hypothetical protein